MKLAQAIAGIDKLKSNPYDRAEKLLWLSTLDGMVKTRILDAYEGGREQEFSSYTEETPDETQLLIPAPYDQIYLWYLAAQMDYYNGEITRYNNAIALFESGYEAFARYYHRTHRPLPGRTGFSQGGLL